MRPKTIRSWSIMALAAAVICMPPGLDAVSADPPAGYYAGTEGLSGNALKSALYNIIKGHTEFPYTSTGTDVWDILKETDRDPTSPSDVVLLYTGWTKNGVAEYDGGNGWSREHVWAKSHGDFGTTMGPGTDVHALRPVDVTVNSARGNKDFENGGTEYIDGDGPTGCYTDTYTWEPRPVVKGDVARMILYMAIRYEGEGDEPDLEPVDYVNSSPAKEPYHGKLSTLLQWHLDDPPDAWEMNRNDIIFGSYQHNRNPFIDHPEFACLIWDVGPCSEPPTGACCPAVGLLCTEETEAECTAGDGTYQGDFTSCDPNPCAHPLGQGMFILLFDSFPE